ncbi:unnamed protein product, partial [Owenia fusiformis]
ADGIVTQPSRQDVEESVTILNYRDGEVEFGGPQPLKETGPPDDTTLSWDNKVMTTTSEGDTGERINPRPTIVKTELNVDDKSYLFDKENIMPDVKTDPDDAEETRKDSGSDNGAHAQGNRSRSAPIERWHLPPPLQRQEEFTIFSDNDQAAKLFNDDLNKRTLAPARTS